MKKRLFSWLIIATMILSLGMMTASAEATVVSMDATRDNITFTFDSAVSVDSATLTGSDGLTVGTTLSGSGTTDLTVTPSFELDTSKSYILNLAGIGEYIITFTEYWNDNFDTYATISDAAPYYSYVWTGSPIKDRVDGNIAGSYKLYTDNITGDKEIELTAVDSGYAFLKVISNENSEGFDIITEMDVRSTSVSSDVFLRAGYGGDADTDIFYLQHGSSSGNIHEYTGGWAGTNWSYNNLNVLASKISSGFNFKYRLKYNGASDQTGTLTTYIDDVVMTTKTASLDDNSKANYETDLFVVALTNQNATATYIDNLLIYSGHINEYVAPALTSITGTKTEIELNYDGEVFGNFSLKQGESSVASDVSITNEGKTVVITPASELSLDTVYEINEAVSGYSQAFALKTLFADNFDDYTTVADMDKKWNVSIKDGNGNNIQNSVSGYNTEAEIHKLADDSNSGKRLFIDGYSKNAIINVKAYDVSEWNKYTLEFDIEQPAGQKWWFDVFYHMYRNDDGKAKDSNNGLRLGLSYPANHGYQTGYEGAWNSHQTYTTGFANVSSCRVKLTTKTGSDIQIFKDGVSAYSNTTTTFENGEFGFRCINTGYQYYIDNVVAYKLVTLDTDSVFIKDAFVVPSGNLSVAGQYEVVGDATGTVIAAVYDKDNKLLGMAEATNGTFNVGCDSTKAAKVKVFLWDSLDGMKPLANADSRAVAYWTYQQ